MQSPSPPLHRTSRFATAELEAARQEKFHGVRTTKPRSQILSRGIIAFTLLIALGRTTEQERGQSSEEKPLRVAGLLARLPGREWSPGANNIMLYYAFCEIMLLAKCRRELESEPVRADGLVDRAQNTEYLLLSASISTAGRWFKQRKQDREHARQKN